MKAVRTCFKTSLGERVQNVEGEHACITYVRPAFMLKCLVSDILYFKCSDFLVNDCYNP